MTERSDADSTKSKNIIDMALGFTAMMRILFEGSKARIEAKLEELFENLATVSTREDYETCHRSFCEWFTCEIRTAPKNLKNGQTQPSEAASYGQAAKVLDIAVKVYVYYCNQPTLEIAQRIVPFLHGAVDTPIMQNLRSKYPATKIRAKTIKDVDEETYLALQSLVLRESLARGVHPVQCDDIMWRQLNRE